MADLRRLKPDPTPPIDPIPEHMADRELAAVYARTMAGLGVPWMGVVAMAFAHYPRFYSCLWSAMEPMVKSRQFHGACRDLRGTAEREARALGPVSIRSRLQEMGYAGTEIDEILACNEIFASGNMPYLLMATLARMLLEGHGWHGQDRLETAHPRGEGRAKPILIEPHHADPTVNALYNDMRRTLGLPFVNTDYRAFARWPSYLGKAWPDLKAAIEGKAYEARVAAVHNRAVTLAGALPNPTGLSADGLADAAAADAPVAELREVVRLFQWLLPGLTVNVAFLRAQLAG